MSFTIAAGSRQPSHFSVSDSRLPFSSPSTTRRATVEIFDPASTGTMSRIHNPLVFITARLSAWKTLNPRAPLLFHEVVTSEAMYLFQSNSLVSKCLLLSLSVSTETVFRN
jgi:hypothetical protein